MEELPDLCDGVAERPAVLAASLKRTVDAFPCDRTDDGCSVIVADNPRGCRA